MLGAAGRLEPAIITGAHCIIYSTDAEADRAFLRDVLGLSGVDVGGGWLIFGLPPAEVAVHPAERSDGHEIYLLCEDADAFVAAMSERGFVCEPIEEPSWGRVTFVRLPSGAKLGVYEPRHARPKAVPSAY